MQDNPIHFPDLETQLYPVGLLDFCTQGHISQVDEGKDWSHTQLILKYMESCSSRVLPMLAASTANALQGNSGASWIAGHFGSMKKRFVPSLPPWEKQPFFCAARSFDAKSSSHRIGARIHNSFTSFH